LPIFIRSRKQQLDAIRKFGVGDTHAQALRFNFQLFLEYKLFNNLLRIEWRKRGRDLLALLNPLELLLHRCSRDGLSGHGGDYVGAGGVRAGSSRHKIQQHSYADHADKNAQHDARA
jgi:hypothetical protein